MKFIKDYEHEQRITELIESSNKVIICSGWLYNSGLKLLVPSMIKNMENKDNSIIIYSSKEHSQIRDLNKLTKYSNFTSKIIKNKNGKVHTKLYYFEFKNYFIAIIGSANITKGGLSNNKELSLEMEDLIDSDNYIYIQNYIKSLAKLEES